MLETRVFELTNSNTAALLVPAAASLGLVIGGGRLLRSLDPVTVTFNSVGNPASGGGGWGLAAWFRYWEDAGGAVRFETQGIPFFRQYTVAQYQVRDRMGFGFLDTTAHEGFHIFIGRFFPQLVDAGRVPLIGGPANFLNETLAYSIGRLASGRLHALPLAPWHAFRYLGTFDQIEVIFAGYLLNRFWPR